MSLYLSSLSSPPLWFRRKECPRLTSPAVVALSSNWSFSSSFLIFFCFPLTYLVLPLWYRLPLSSLFLKLPSFSLVLMSTNVLRRHCLLSVHSILSLRRPSAHSMKPTTEVISDLCDRDLCPNSCPSFSSVKQNPSVLAEYKTARLTMASPRFPCS